MNAGCKYSHGVVTSQLFQIQTHHRPVSNRYDCNHQNHQTHEHSIQPSMGPRNTVWHSRLRVVEASSRFFWAHCLQIERELIFNIMLPIKAVIRAQRGATVKREREGGK